MQVQIHRLASGEKLSDVARFYGCTTSHIAALNPHKESFEAPGLGSFFTSLDEHEPIYVPTGLGLPLPPDTSVIRDNPSLCPIGATADANPDADGITVNVTCNCPHGMTIDTSNETKNPAGIKAGACVVASAPHQGPPTCPPATGTLGPPNIPVYGGSPSPLICNPPAGANSEIVNLCNTSRDPLFCYFTKVCAKPPCPAYKNRGTKAAVAAWRAWGPGNPTANLKLNPDGSPASSSGPSDNPNDPGKPPSDAGGSSNTILYVGLGVVALIGLGFAMRPRR